MDELNKTLYELLEHARAEGTMIEGEVSEFLAHMAERIETLTLTIGKDVGSLIHSDLIEKLGHLVENMHAQVEGSESLKSFWESMVEEIPDLIEWIHTIMEKGAEVAAEAVVESADIIEAVAEKI